MKIALISDIHFGLQSTTDELVVPGQKATDRRAPNAFPFFSGVIEILKNEHPDYLFIAGDLTSTASPLEYRYCYEQLLKFESEAGICRNNWTVCLGNHDVDRKISDLGKIEGEYASDDKEYTIRHYMDTRTADLNSHNIIHDLSESFSPNYEKCSIPMTGVVEHEDCIVFVLNSGYLCTANSSGGKLDIDQLNWFKNAVRKYNSENLEIRKAKIAILHHHPYDHEYPFPVRDLSKLEEGPQLHSCFGELGIDLVIHGHRHHPIAKTFAVSGNWANPVSYICCGSLSVCKKERAEGLINNAFHIVNYINAENIILETYTYDDRTGWQKKGDRDIDGEVRLGRIIYTSEMKQIIQALPINRTISYSSLPDELKYCPCKHLNTLLDEIHTPMKRQIHGKFPEDVCILSSELLEVTNDGNQEIQRTAVTI